jgi:putative ABC transport system permease protein
MALGAGRGRLLRQLLTESLLVALAGGALGVLLAWWGVDAMRVAAQADSGSLGVRVPRLGEVGIDGMVLAFSTIVSLLAGIVFGVFPALQATRVDANDSLKEGGRGTSEGSHGLRLRGALVVSEVAITLVLLAGAGLLLRSFLSLRAIDGGFEADHLLTMTVSVAGLPQYAGSSREALYAAIEESVRALPGVVSASMVNHLPVGGDTWGSRVYVENQPLPKPGEEIHATYRVCRPGYFQTMGIRLAGGRDFNAHDSETGVPVILINQRLARSVWGAESAIGKRLSVDGEPGKPVWRTVVGVYRDVRQDSWPMQPSNEYYVPLRQDAGFLASTRPWMSSMTLVVRTGVDPATLTNAVKEAIWARDRNIPISEVRTMEQILRAALWQARFQMLIFSVFAAFALVLAAIGMYGVVAYSAGRRTHEIGIRMALGARRGEVIWMVLRQGLSLVGAGIGIGLGAALVVTRSMKSLLYGVTASDPLTFALIPAVLAAVAAAASYLPARRASGIDPVSALRCE